MAAVIKVTGGNDQLTSLQIVLVHHLRSIGIEVPGRKYFETEVRLHQEYLVQHKEGMTIQAPGTGG